jgi:lipopolysaccharide export system permease protein
MAFNTIINRQIFREITAPFMLALGLLTILFLMAEMIKITNWIVNFGIGLADVLIMLALLIPSFMVFIIPMALLFAVLLTFMRMSGDNEIVALKSGGATIYGLLAPVIFFSLIACAMTLSLTVYGAPWGQAALKDLIFKVLTTRIDIGLKEMAFNDALDKVILYVGHLDPKTRRLTDVFIEDKRQPENVSTVVAPEGQLFSDPKNAMLYLVLRNGSIQQTNLKARRSQSIRFTTYQLSFNVRDNPAFDREKARSTRELTYAGLREMLASLPPGKPLYQKTLTVMHRMIALPFACVALAVLALPLGIQTRTAKRSIGLVLSIACVLLYYLLLTLGYTFSEKGLVSPLLAMWFPNFAVGAMGLYFLVQTARERSSLVGRVHQRIQRAAATWGGGRKA